MGDCKDTNAKNNSHIPQDCWVFDMVVTAGTQTKPRVQRNSLQKRDAQRNNSEWR